MLETWSPMAIENDRDLWIKVSFALIIHLDSKYESFENDINRVKIPVEIIFRIF